MVKAKEDVKEKEVNQSDAEVITNVAPIESVETEEKEFDKKTDCWNCRAKLDSEGKCDNCGFDKSLLFNLDLEAENAIERQKAQQTQPAK